MKISGNSCVAALLLSLFTAQSHAETLDVSSEFSLKDTSGEEIFYPPGSYEANFSVNKNEKRIELTITDDWGTSQFHFNGANRRTVNFRGVPFTLNPEATGQLHPLNGKIKISTSRGRNRTTTEWCTYRTNYCVEQSDGSLECEWKELSGEETTTYYTLTTSWTHHFSLGNDLAEFNASGSSSERVVVNSTGCN